VLEEVCAEGLDERGGVVVDGAGRDFGVEGVGDSLPAVGLHDGDDLRGLRMLVMTICEYNRETYLEVDVLESPHYDAVQRVLWQLQAGVLLQALDVDEGAHELGVQQGLVRQSLDVLGCVGVDVLQRARELVVEALHKRDDAAGDAENLALGDGRQLLVILPLLGVLNDNDLLGVLQDLEQFAEFLVGAVVG